MWFTSPPHETCGPCKYHGTCGLWSTRSAIVHVVHAVTSLHMCFTHPPPIWSAQTPHGPWASYQIRKIAGYREQFPCHRLQRKPLASDPGSVTHVPWCMSGSLARKGVENVPGIPGACATRNFTYLSRGPCGPRSQLWFTHPPHGTCGPRIHIMVHVNEVNTNTSWHM